MKVIVNHFIDNGIILCELESCDFDEDSITSSCESFEAPPFSPIVSDCVSDSDSNTDLDLDIPTKQSDTVTSTNPVPTCDVALQECGSSEEDISGYKGLGDNFDCNIHSRYVRMERYQHESCHYFHFCIVRDRINLSNLPITCPDTCFNQLDKLVLELLPSALDDEELTANISVLIERIIVSHMPFFKFAFADVVDWHIKHEHYEEMSSKSKVVSNVEHVK